MDNYNIFTLFCWYSKITIKSWFQYKVNACLLSLTVFLREATNIIIIYLTLMTFHSINGWNQNELLFLYSLIFLTYGLLVIFFTGLRDFDQMVVTGTFDRFILRPQGLLFQVILSNADWFAAIGHGGLGVLLFLVTANKVGIVWNLSTVVYYVLIIISGTIIQGAIFLIFATLSFYVMKSANIREVFYWNMRKFAGYPLSIYPRIIQFALTYIMPFAFVNYFPAQYLLKKDDLALYPRCYVYLTPVISVILFLLAYFFWRLSLRKYTSSGN